MQVYAEIQRVDTEQRMVWGYASTDQPALDGLTITRAALEDAVDDYMVYANIREMHRNSAVGTASEAEMDDTGLYIGAHVSDDTAWKKVTDKVYKGFSIGAKITSRDAEDNTIVRSLKLLEISLVDRPCDPGAMFDVFRRAPDDEAVERAEFTAAERKKLAKSGAAMPDGSFPIRNKSDLENAIQAVGRAKNRAAAKRHIKERAKTLGLESSLPEDWGSVSRAATADNQETVMATEDENKDGVTAPVDAAPATDVAAAVEPVTDTPPELTDVQRAAATAEAAVAAAEAAVNNLDRATTESATDNLRRGLSMVGRLGCLLTELCYVIKESTYEAELERDGSTVPAKLRAPLVALAAAYKDMATEEVEELMASVSPEAMKSMGQIYYSASGADLERIASPSTVDATELERTIGANSAEIQRLNTAVSDLTQQRDEVLRVANSTSQAVVALTERLERFSQTIVPPKTAGAGARPIAKEEDASGDLNRTAAQAATPSEEDIQRVLDAMPADERALILTRAALRQPRAIGNSPSRQAP